MDWKLLNTLFSTLTNISQPVKCLPICLLITFGYFFYWMNFRFYGQLLYCFNELSFVVQSIRILTTWPKNYKFRRRKFLWNWKLITNRYFLYSKYNGHFYNKLKLIIRFGSEEVYLDLDGKVSGSRPGHDNDCTIGTYCSSACASHNALE